MNRPWKVALLHDYLDEFSGSTRVISELAKIFSDADLFSLYINNTVKKNNEITRQFNTVNYSFLQQIPGFISFRWRKMLSLFLGHYYWENLNLKGYDLVISSSFGFGSVNVNVVPGTLHIAYIHTPQKRFYFEKRLLRNNSPIWLDFIFRCQKARDLIAHQKPRLLITNSNYTKEKVRYIYHRLSKVIYPPISVPKVNQQLRYSDKYYVYFGRVTKEKGIDIIIKAFNRNKKKLVVIGDGPDLRSMKMIAGKNIHFTGFLSDKSSYQKLASAKALVFASKHEDFGMVAVEAQTLGVPVIAFNAGGIREIVKSPSLGVLFDDYSVEGILLAVAKFEKKTFYRSTIRRNAIKYSAKYFRIKILKIISEK